jgi:hypothetical protein
MFSGGRAIGTQILAESLPGCRKSRMPSSLRVKRCEQTMAAAIDSEGSLALRRPGIYVT